MSGRDYRNKVISTSINLFTFILLIFYTMINPCLSYFTHVSSTGEPILGTMFSDTTGQGQATCGRLIARVPAYQVNIHNECRPASGLRYFYRYNSQTNRIVPNSMFSGSHKPKSMCSGTSRILEFIVTQHS